MNNKVKQEQLEKAMIDQMMGLLKTIYSNKSSDEYKSHGDITKSSIYNDLENDIAGLRVIKKLPSTDVTDIKNLFNVLHRPIFSKMVTEYIMEPNERNAIFTAVYTVGFRVLVAEVERIITCTITTDKGIEYRPNKLKKKENMVPFIRAYNNNIEERLDNYIRMAYRKNGGKSVNESYDFTQEGVGDVALSLYKIGFRTGKNIIVKFIYEPIKTFFRGITSINPLVMINTFLTRSYEKKVEKFEEISDLYLATKLAYEDYMKIPSTQRNKKIESKYLKNMDKYNIKMQNLAATLIHYDERAQVEAAKLAASDNADNDTSTNDNTDSSSGDPSGNEDYGF